MLDRKRQSPPPSAIQRLFYRVAVDEQEIEQGRQVSGLPVLFEITLSKTNVTKAQRLLAHAPVLDVNLGLHTIAALAKHPLKTRRPTHTQLASGNALEQGEQALGSPRQCGNAHLGRGSTRARGGR